MGDRSVPLDAFHTFGDLLKYLRRRAQLTQRELSIAVGYSEAQISRLEANLRLPDRASLLALFVPALLIKDEPKTIDRLLELAQAGQLGSKREAPAIEPGLFQAVPEKSHPHNLPLQLTSFIGREAELLTLCQLITAGPTRLVTLTGSGGVGKTRLAIRVAEEVLNDFADGVWLVALAPLVDPGLVAQEATSVLGLQQRSGQTITQALCDYLQPKRLLLLLDNCEHLVSTAAELAETLLRACPHLRILATSREMLGVDGETPFRCPSLSLPDPQHLPPAAEITQSEAVCLFVTRANTVLPGFTVTDKDAGAVVQICRRLDGIPLAIELAAARLNMLTTEQIASRLDSAFRLLTGGSRTALPRQQTLRATIDWSYELLSAPEQILLRRLAVFAGGSTLEAIETVCAGGGLEAEQILDLLSGLINKSIVSAESKQQEETRYRLLETVRQYAREKLYEAKESQVFYDRHFDYFLELAEAIEPQLRTSMALEWLHTLDSEMDNLRTALSWALDEIDSIKIEAGLRLASALLNLWHTQNFHNEGYTWLNKGLTAEPSVPVESRVRARACFAAGHLILPLGNTVEAQQWLQESLAIYRKIEDTRGMVMAQSLLGEIYAWSGLFDEAKELGAASLAICRTLNDAWLLAWVLCRFGTSLSYQGEPALAQPLLEESLAIFERLGDPLQVGDDFDILGNITFEQGDITGAHAYYTKYLTSGQAMHSKWTEAIAWYHLGSLAYVQGDYQQMQSDLLESVALDRQTGNQGLSNSLLWLGIAEINLAHPKQAVLYFKECLQISSTSEDVAGSLLGIARAALQTNQPRIAAHLLVTGKRLFNEYQQFGRIQQEEYERGWAEIKAQLGEPALEQAMSEGVGLSQDEAVAMALAVIETLS